MFKVVEGLMSAMQSSEYLDQVQNKRTIRATSYKAYEITKHCVIP